MPFAIDMLTDDGFLGGRVQVLQPRTGYRAATDPVLLAAAVAALAGQQVLELGCGAGVASLCLAARIPGLTLTGLEMQADYADLARRNAARNGIDMRVIIGSVAAVPATLRAEVFDHVIANPPYFAARAGTAAVDPGREAALRETVPLADWIAAGLRRIRPGGHITVIQSADRLPDLLAALGAGAGDMAVRPVQSRAGRPASRVIVQARKGARGPFRLAAPFVLHDGAAHTADGDDHTAQARAVLRDAGAIPV